MQRLLINCEIEEAQDKDLRERSHSAVRYALSCHFEWTNWKKRGKLLVVLCLIEDAVFVSKRLVNHLFPGHSGCSQALVNCTCCRGSRAAGLQIAIELGFERAVWLLFAHGSVAAWWLSLVLTPLSSHSVLIPRHQRWSLSIESGRFKSKHTKYFWQLCLHFHHFFKIPSNDFLCPSQLSVMIDHYMVYTRNTLDASNLRTSWEIGNFWMSDLHLDGLANRVVPKY